MAWQSSSAVAATEASFRRLDVMIEDEMSYSRDPDKREHHQWPEARYDELRNEAIDLISRLIAHPGAP